MLATYVTSVLSPSPFRFSCFVTPFRKFGSGAIAQLHTTPWIASRYLARPAGTFLSAERSPRGDKPAMAMKTMKAGKKAMKAMKDQKPKAMKAMKAAELADPRPKQLLRSKRRVCLRR